MRPMVPPSNKWRTRWSRILNNSKRYTSPCTWSSSLPVLWCFRLALGEWLFNARLVTRYSLCGSPFQKVPATWLVDHSDCNDPPLFFPNLLGHEKHLITTLWNRPTDGRESSRECSFLASFLSVFSFSAASALYNHLTLLILYDGSSFLLMNSVWNYRLPLLPLRGGVGFNPLACPLCPIHLLTT